MPRREDERRLNLSAKHPAACTCQDCTDKFLNKQAAKAKKAPKQKKKKGMKEPVKRHPVGCACASCTLLGTIDLSQEKTQGGAGIIKKLLGKR
jgi:hypothetical protein